MTQDEFRKWAFQQAQVNGYTIVFRKENGVNVEAICKETGEKVAMPWNKK